MATNNDITRRMITTAIKPTTDAYREGWERVFGDKNCMKTPIIETASTVSKTPIIETASTVSKKFEVINEEMHNIENKIRKVFEVSFKEMK